MRPLRMGAVLLLLAGLVLAAPADAEGPRPRGVRLRIGAVVASNSGQTFDKRLASLRRQFHLLFPYTSYQLIKQYQRDLRWGERAAFDLPGGRYLLVYPRGIRNGRVALKVILVTGSRTPLLDTVLAIRNRGTFLVGGPAQGDGVLIIAIGADAR